MHVYAYVYLHVFVYGYVYVHEYVYVYVYVQYVHVHVLGHVPSGRVGRWSVVGGWCLVVDGRWFRVDGRESVSCMGCCWAGGVAGWLFDRMRALLVGWCVCRLVGWWERAS